MADKLKTPPGWLTYDEVMDLLGHRHPNSTAVWMTRRGIQGTTFYPAAEIRAARSKDNPKRIGPRERDDVPSPDAR